MYEAYVSYINDVNAQYGFNIKPRPNREIQSQNKISQEIDKIDKIVRQSKK